MPNSIYDPDRRIPVATRRLYAGELVATEESRLSVTPRMGFDGELTTRPQMARIVDEYRDAQKELWFRKLAVKGADALLPVVTSQISLGQMETKSAFAKPVMSASASMASAYIHNKLVDEVQQRAERDLSHQLSFWSRQQFNDFKTVYQTDPAQFLRKLWGSDQYQLFFGKPLLTDPAGTRILQQQQIQILTRRVASNQVEDFVRQGVLQSEIDQTRQDVHKFIGAQSRWNEDVTSNLADTRDALAGLKDQFAQQKASTDFLFQSMFSGMPPSRQLKAIQAGLGPKLAADEVAKIELAAKWEGINQSVGKAADVVGNALTIFKALGAPPEFTQKISAAATAGKSIVAAIGLISTGGVLEGAALIAQLFGSSDSDSATAQLNAQITGLYHALEQLSKQIEKGFQAVLDRIDQVFDAVLVNRAMDFEHGPLARLSRSSTFLQKRADFHYLTGEQRFSSYQSAAAHFQAAAEDYHEGKRALEEFFGEENRTAISSLFYTRSLLTAAPEQDHWDALNKALFEPALRLAKYDAHRRGIGPEQYLSRFLFPSPSCDVLPLKFAPEWNWQRHPDYIATNLEDLLAQPLYPPLVKTAAHYVAQFDPYYQWVDTATGRTLLPLDKLLTREPLRVYANFLIHRALQVVEVAIAQQTLIAGDVLLEFASWLLEHDDYVRVIGASGPPPGFGGPDGADLLSIVEASPLFASNFLLYVFRKLLRPPAGELRVLAYAYALGRETAGPLNAILGSRWSFHHVSGEDPQQKGPGFSKLQPGWAVAIGRIFINLPTPDQLLSGVLNLPKQLALLVEARSEILSLLLDESFPARLTAVDRSLCYRTLVSDIVSRATVPGTLLDWPPASPVPK